MPPDDDSGARNRSIDRRDPSDNGPLPWPIGHPPPDYVLTGVRAVLPDRLLPDARIVVRNGRIEEVAPAGAVRGDVDGRGLLVLPGLIDVHSDALERERAPRPTATLPWDFALTAFEGRLVGAGVTTAFHGAAFQHQHARGVVRDPADALALARTVDAADTGLVDHRVLHRLDVTSAAGAAALQERLAQAPTGSLVSFEDHTPGQGQYADPEALVRSIIGEEGVTADEARARVVRLRDERGGTADAREAAVPWLAGLAHEGRIRLLGHDPDTVEAVEQLEAHGAVAAEFPTTIEAARAARTRGLLVVAGAPNLLRGASHSGNVSAAALLAEGLVDALASDYLPPALLGAVAQATRDAGLDLPAAVRLVTAGPATVAGLEDRGRLAPGLRADFVLVDDSTGRWPRVVRTLTSSGRPSSRPRDGDRH